MPRPAEGTTRPAAGACAWVRERIDPLLDGELAAAEEAKLQGHLSACPACRSEVALARSLQGALRDGLPPLTCPPEVTARVMQIARREEAGRALPRSRARSEARPEARPESDGSGGLAAWLAGLLGGSGLLRPALAAAALVLLLAAPFVYRSLLAPGRPAAPAVATLPPSQTAAPGAEAGGAAAAAGVEGYSPEEVAEARAQARLVLAYVAEVGRNAGRAVQDDVFADGIVRPTRRAVESLSAVPAPRRKP
jgi:anti-sigma factor RsiW